MSLPIPSSTFIGRKFNNLIVVQALPNLGRYRYVVCKCDCGTTRNFQLDNVRSGKTKSCGCVRVIKNNIRKHPLYSLWAGIKTRCYNKNDASYKYYGGRGVSMCDEWIKNYDTFYNWAISNGYKKGLDIDKDIKGNGLIYSPDTCLFVTTKVNCNNRRSSKRLTLNGVTKTVAEWSDGLNISQQLIYRRIKNGWSVEKSLTTPKLC